MVSSLGRRSELERVREYIYNGIGMDYAPGSVQRPTLGVFPGLTAKPWHDPSEHLWTNRLVESFPMIHREFEEIKRLNAYVPQQGSYALNGQWNVFHFSIMGQPTCLSRRLCPATSQLVAELPGVGEAGMVFFSAMTPGTCIQAHCDLSNTRLRCHLGLSIPDGCSMRVDREIRRWEEGRCLVFDGSFEHEVWHSGSETRWVLILDFWHPDLTDVERRALARISNVRPFERSIRKKLMISERLFPNSLADIPGSLSEVNQA